MTQKSKKLIVAVLSMLMLGAFGIVAQAQNSFVPLSISVAPGFGGLTSPTFNVSATVDRDSAGQGNATYQINEIMRITTRPDIASFVYLFNIRATGEIDIILPNSFENVEYAVAGQARVFPSAARGYEFRVAGALGRSHIMAVATQSQLTAQQLQQISGQRVSSSTNALGQTVLSMTFPQITQAWAVNVMPFNVGTTGLPPVNPPIVPPVMPPSTNQFGTLHVQTNLVGARVLINNQDYGSTDTTGRLNLNLPVGSYRIRIQAPAAGFLTYDDSFVINTNQQSDVLVAF